LGERERGTGFWFDLGERERNGASRERVCVRERERVGERGRERDRERERERNRRFSLSSFYLKAKPLFFSYIKNQPNGNTTKV
jgi:hypothetical protein